MVLNIDSQSQAVSSIQK